MTDRGAGRREDTGERSDLFSLDKAVDQIPDVEEVLLPPEEQRRLKVRRMLIIAASIAALLVLLVVAWRVMHARTLAEAVTAASDGGRVAALERARDLADADDLPALSARLTMILALAGAPADLDAVQSALDAAEQSGASGDELLDARLAQTYLALARLDGAAALTAEGSLRAVGPAAAEVAHAKALTGLAVGDLEHARALAAVAVRESPNGARHLALAGLVTARSDAAEALTTLEHAPPSALQSPAVRCVRARLNLRLGDTAKAVEEADAVNADDEATPRERAWASLVIATARALAGDETDAKAQAQALLATPVIADEAFALRLAEALLLAGDPDGAARARAHLSTSYSTDPAWRARVNAWQALSTGDAAAARTALTHAGTSPETSWLGGRLAELEQRIPDARAGYASASTDGLVGPRAALSLSRLELRAGNAAAAAEAIRTRAAADPTHASMAVALAEALTADGHADQAAATTRAALVAHADDPHLQAALGHALAAQGDHEAARAALAQATETLSGDVELLADLSVEARLTDHGDEARRAAEAALALDASHIRALSNLLTLELDEHHSDAAGLLLERLDGADAGGLPLDLERARYWVDAGAGLAGLRPVRRAMRRFGRDPTLRIALGDLYLQAEMWPQALQSFQGAARRGAPDLPVAVGTGLAQIGMRRLPPALATLERVRALPGAAESARAEVLASNIELFQRHIRPARQAAERALGIDANDAEAHLLLGKLRRITGGDVVAELRASLAAPRTPPDTLARLARTLGSNDEGCALARRFRRAAPAGDGARDMRELLRECPR